MSIAIFTTWTTYGTWLPGDQRGWYDPGLGLRPPDELQQLLAALRMTEDALLLNQTQRAIVEATIRENCTYRGWELHAVNCRSNHVHVVVSANGAIEWPRETFMAWCTRRLKPTQPDRAKGWTERGWDVYVDSQRQLEDVVVYVVEGQTGRWDNGVESKLRVGPR